MLTILPFSRAAHRQSTPRDAVLRQKAFSAIESKNYGEAVQLLKTLLARNPQANPARRMLAVALQKQQRFEEAHEQFVRLNRGIIFSQYEDVVRWVAEEKREPLLDLTPEFSELRPGTLYVDDMHPNADGQRIIARRLFQELNQ